jgi:hypothetical protein
MHVSLAMRPYAAFPGQARARKKSPFYSATSMATSGGSKRRHGASFCSASDSATGIELVDMRMARREPVTFIDALSKPFNIAGAVFDMMKVGEKELLASALWRGDFGESMAALRSANPHLVAVLKAQISNTRVGGGIENKDQLIDGMLINICRAHNQHHMPLITAGLSLLAEANCVPRQFHDAMSHFFRGGLASEKWVRDNLPKMREMRPPPVDEMLVGVTAKVFDNLTMHIDYHSFSSEGVTGTKLDMTNWITVPIPKKLVAPGFDAGRICARPPADLPFFSPLCCC